MRIMDEKQDSLFFCGDMTGCARQAWSTKTIFSLLISCLFSLLSPATKGKSANKPSVWYGYRSYGREKQMGNRFVKYGLERGTARHTAGEVCGRREGWGWGEGGEFKGSLPSSAQWFALMSGIMTA